MSAVLSSAAPEAPQNAARAAARTSALPVSFRALRRTFGKGSAAHTVLRDVDFEVRSGEVLAILGTSGCGKSTLLRATAGLDSPSSGSVDIDGTPVQGIDARCAFAFQEPRLLPWHTLQANIAIGLPTGVSARDGKAKVTRLLELVGLKDFAKHRPREISGGMAQRASLARALARNPGVLLLDEPFGALDALTRIKMQDLLLDIHRAAPTTVLLVTHDVDEALQLADRIIILGKEPDEDGAAAPGATIVRTVVVPGERPRDRGSVELARMRASLLESLGVDGH
ncbi:sulfonate transport system ATP-binding protein [Arthrobacter sp. V4I6]|uniref:ABC transporter ATP-binding protein n=1 Tax=unclassified Arthrobacter TaxID=235627 RepID=UPI0027806EF0|nr:MULTISPECIES: ABC transporter ATP-binding protein [unclassified Arthrobacter]MDQ0822927.1 sulfonate transport system ATP-binding protein [Arthrobacter sp. V1I7]MDQ0852556.1 sulfonate transport system ATP-binding protein [Arthrobacter sp. V4I6]